MGTLSKNKGNTFERKVAKILSQRFFEHTGILQSFRRDASSGSFFGASNQKRLQTHDAQSATFGDIIAPKDFKFSIECKHYKDAPSYLSMLKQDNKTFDTWLAQAEQDARNSNKEVLIVAKFNNVPEMALISEQIWNNPCGITYKGYSIVLLERFLERFDEFFFN